MAKAATAVVEEVPVDAYEVTTQMLRVGQQTPEVRFEEDGRLAHIGANGAIDPAGLSRHIEAMTKRGFQVASFEIAAVERDGSINLSFVWAKTPAGPPYKQWAIVIRPAIDGAGMQRANQALVGYLKDGFTILGHRIFARSANAVSVLWWLVQDR